jgi:hypothetical protein
MKFLLIFFYFLSAHALAAKPPEAAMNQLQIMATVQAAIQVCLNSPEYKQLPATEALKFHAITSRASDIIEKIEKRYDDDLAYLAFMSASMQIGDTPEFKRAFASTYSRKCAQQLLIDSTETLNTVSDRVNSLIKKK